MRMDEETTVTPEQRERSGRREQNKAENRTALLKAARAVFAEPHSGQLAFWSPLMRRSS